MMCRPRSSSGLGRRPLTAETGVRLSYGVQIDNLKSRGYSSVGRVKSRETEQLFDNIRDMDTKDLTEKVNAGLSTREIADQLGCSQTNVQYWIRKLGLQTEYATRTYCCKQCGETSESKMMRNGKTVSRTLCKSCHNQNTIERGRQNRQVILDELGGCCTRCGYDNPVALDIHHTTERKDPNFSTMKYWKLERALEEIKDCVLLCANCHREEHAADHIS